MTCLTRSSTSVSTTSTRHIATSRVEGCSFEGPPHIIHEDESAQLWLAFFRDPDGTLLALMEERALLVAEK